MPLPPHSAASDLTGNRNHGLVDPDDVRTMFSKAMSDMYRKEVPLYSELLDLVREVNEATIATDPVLKAALEQRSEMERLNLERHGAIRVGKPEELRMLGRMFRIMGMEPVSYYDLSTAGLPVHATAFRPTRQESLDKNPFRIFTSLLRPELIADTDTRELALKCLAGRQIFSDACLDMIQLAETQGGMTPEEAKRFVAASMETFRWHTRSKVSKGEYDKLSKAHKLAADVCAFQTCHINHLTPRTLDIEAVQRGMAARNIPPKAVIEGPPPLSCPILLRQTSFLALSEQTEFLDPETGTYVSGHHQARFGEIEQRSLALTQKGRAMYSRLLREAQSNLPSALVGSPAHSRAMDLNAMNEDHLLQYFSAFPSTYEGLRKRDLGFFRYKVRLDAPPLEVKSDSGFSLDAAGSSDQPTLDELIASGHVEFEPLLYEDFLPASAAGIFQSNLGQVGVAVLKTGPDQLSFERALGRQVIDEFELYETSQQESLDAVAQHFGLAFLSRE